MPTDRDTLLTNILNDPAFLDILKQKADALKIDLSKIKDEDLAATRRAPKHWKNGAVAVYFTEDFALVAKKVLDELDKCREANLFFPAEDISVTTLYLRWSQGKQYLLEFMDENGTYKDLASKIRVHKWKQRGTTGLLFKWRQSEKFVTPALQKIERTPQWKLKLDDFIETAQVGQRLKMEGLLLNDADMQYVNDLVADLPAFLCNVSSKHITIIKQQDSLHKYDTRKLVEDVGISLGKAK